MFASAISTLKKIHYKTLAVVMCFTCSLGVLSVLSPLFITNFVCLRVLETFNKFANMVIPCFSTINSASLYVTYFSNGLVDNTYNIKNIACLSNLSFIRIIVGYGTLIFASFVCVEIIMQSSFSLNFFCLNVFLAFQYLGLLSLLLLLSSSLYCYPGNYTNVSYYGMNSLESAHILLDGTGFKSNFPFCFNLVLILEVLTLLPFFFFAFIFFLRFNYTLKQNSVIFFSLIVVILCNILYNLKLPILFSAPHVDSDRVSFRLLGHTCFTEILGIISRYAVMQCTMNLSNKIIFLFFQESFVCLYSRMLVSSISSTVLLAVSTILISVSDIVSKTSMRKRDVFMKNIINKIIAGKVSADDASLKLSERCVLVKTSLEISSIISVASFFSFLLLPNSCLTIGLVSSFPATEGYRLRGFKVELLFLKDCAIQMAIEFCGVFVFFLLDVILSLNITFWDFSLLKLFAHLHIFFVCFTFMFYFTLFFFPVFIEQPYDLYGTWLNYLPSMLTGFLVEWLTNSLDCLSSDRTSFCPVE